MHVETSFVRKLGDLIRVRRGTPDRLMKATADRFFPPIKVLHPLPLHRFDAKTRGRSPVR
jgi:hypothetical protein